MAVFFCGQVRNMTIDKLGDLRLAKGYSLDMMAGWLECTVEQYLELEFGLRLPEGMEQQVLEKLFGNAAKDC